MADRNGNSNCLEGVECPKCKSAESFEIVARITVEVTDEGTEDMMDGYEWGDSASCVCGKCKHAGLLRDFKIEIEDRDEDAADFYIASVHTRHFFFEGAGYSERAAKESLKEVLEAHAASVEGCIENFAEHFMEDAEVKGYIHGIGFRDHSQVKK